MKTAAEKRRERARRLYDERNKKGAFWNGLARSNFIRRVRYLAKSVSVCSNDPDDYATVMFLDAIATREGIDLEYKSE